MRGHKGIRPFSPWPAGLILLVTSALYLMISGLTPALMGETLPGAGDEVSLILLLREADLMCPFCLEPVLEFCRTLPAGFGGFRAWGVLVADEPSEGAGVPALLEKRMRIFRRVNRFPFPLLFDGAGVFSPALEQGTRLLILDEPASELLGYRFPLNPAQAEEIKRRVARLKRDSPV